MRTIHQRRLPFKAWPFRDRRLYVTAIRPGRRSERKPHHGWSPAMCTTVMGGYALSLGWLADNALLDPSCLPAARWPLDVVERYVLALEEKYAETTVVDRVSAVERALSALEPDCDRSALKLALRVLGKPRAKSIDASKLPTTPELVDAAVQSMLAADKSPTLTPQNRAVLIRDGLMTALGAVTYLRPKDLHGLIYWPPDSSAPRLRAPRLSDFIAHDVSGAIYEEKGVWRLKYVASKTRKHKPVARDNHLPSILFPWLQAYVTFHRPILCRGRNDIGNAFWISVKGQPQCYQTTYRAVVKQTGNCFPVALSPRMPRKIGATTISIHAPTAAGDISIGLGHSQPRTTTDHYVLADSVTASSRVNETFEDVRDAALARRRWKWRRKK